MKLIRLYHVIKWETLTIKLHLKPLNLSEPIKFLMNSFQTKYSILLKKRNYSDPCFPKNGLEVWTNLWIMNSISLHINMLKQNEFTKFMKTKTESNAEKLLENTKKLKMEKFIHKRLKNIFSQMEKRKLEKQSKKEIKFRKRFITWRMEKISLKKLKTILINQLNLRTIIKREVFTVKIIMRK